jgi:hypothetical protein
VTALRFIGKCVWEGVNLIFLLFVVFFSYLGAMALTGQ